MASLKLSTFLKLWLPGLARLGTRRALWLATLFFCGVLFLGLHRYFTFYASYDHGLFDQLFWNTTHGRWFQSSLTSANSVATLEDNVTPTVSFLHLGQHMVLDFLLWVPLYALFQHPVTLIVLQVGLMTAGGLVLYALARERLSPQLSLWIMGSYYSANAVIGPTLANFYEHCQIPLFAFGALLAMERKRWGWFTLCAALLLGVREEAGIILFGIGAYLIVSRRHPGIGLATCAVSFGYVAVVTNAIMPNISSDNSRLYLASRFAQYVDTPNPSTLQVLWGMITHPIELLSSVLLPFDKRLNYLLSHWLPLAFVPALSGTAWTIAGFPLLSLMTQQGMSPLVIHLRYAIAVVPGIFYGAILWWSMHPERFTPKIRRFWQVCLALSFVFLLAGNPNRSLSFIIPDSVQPWVYSSPLRLWDHAGHINNVLKEIPKDASVSTTTNIISHISTRRAAARLPQMEMFDDRHQKFMMDYAIADLWHLAEYRKAFRDSGTELARSIKTLTSLIQERGYGLRRVEDGVVLVSKNQPTEPGTIEQWNQLLKVIESMPQRPPKPQNSPKP